jgi:dTDP-4-dehydrorhamnose 3,5-epimerase-like enzyme
MNYIYAVDELYHNRSAADDQAVSLFDPQLGVKWPIPKDQMIISDRDKSAIFLKDLE